MVTTHRSQAEAVVAALNMLEEVESACVLESPTIGASRPYASCPTLDVEGDDEETHRWRVKYTFFLGYRIPE